MKIIFDWNGTLLDDAALAVECVNIVRANRGYDLISITQYRDLFELPIQRFYSKVGLADDHERFKVAMQEYLQHYSSRACACPLHSRVRKTLNELKAKGFQLAILSASSQADLDEALKHRALTDYFDFVVGKRGTDASCKKREAHELTSLLSSAEGDVLYVGDTLHDAEVAAAVGWSCVLVENGHQSPERFTACVQRVPTVSDVISVLQRQGAFA